MCIENVGLYGRLSAWYKVEVLLVLSQCRDSSIP